MRAQLIKGLGFVLLVFVFVIVALHFSIGNIWADKVRSSAANARIALDFKETHFRFPFTAEASGVSVLFPTRPLPLPLYLENIRLKPRMLALLAGSGKFKVSASLYDGKIKGIINEHLLVGDVTGKFKATQLKLERHPLLGGLGLKGDLSFKLDNLTIPDDAMESTGNFTAEIINGSYTGGKLYGFVDLPTVSNITLEINGKKKSSAVVVDKLSFSSSLGTAGGKGRIDFDKNTEISRLNFNFAIDLSPEGQPIVAPYLQLLGNSYSANSANNTQSKWTIEMLKTSKDKTVHFNSNPSL